MKTKLTMSEAMQIEKTPERRLLFAILERAILDLTCKDSLAAQSALNWIHSKDDYAINCYERLCDNVGLQQHYLRDPVILERVKRYYASAKSKYKLTHGRRTSDGRVLQV